MGAAKERFLSSDRMNKSDPQRSKNGTQMGADGDPGLLPRQLQVIDGEKLERPETSAKDRTGHIGYFFPFWGASVPFASAHALFNLSKLAVWWLRLGIGFERIQLGHPQQNGHHERMHLTPKKEATPPAALNFLQQQARFDDFIEPAASTDEGGGAGGIFSPWWAGRQ
jgi:hypothetical protein